MVSYKADEPMLAQSGTSILCSSRSLCEFDMNEVLQHGAKGRSRERRLLAALHGHYYESRKRTIVTLERVCVASSNNDHQDV